MSLRVFLCLPNSASLCPGCAPARLQIRTTKWLFDAPITGKEIADAANQAEAIMQLRVESKQRVDELVDKALAAGGVPLHEINDQGFLYGRSFQDLDRHNWDAFYVDETAMPS